MVLQFCGYYYVCGLDGLHYCWYFKAIWGWMLPLSLLWGNRSGYETLLVSVGLDSAPSTERLPTGQACWKLLGRVVQGWGGAGVLWGWLHFRQKGKGEGCNIQVQFSSHYFAKWVRNPYIQFGSVVCAGNLCTSKLLIQPELLSVLVIRKMCAHKFAYLKCSPLLRKDNKTRGQFSHSTR